MSEAHAIEVSVNGSVRAIAAGASVADLLRALGLSGATVAVERNGVLVPRREHERTQLAAGDRIEVVTLVGGG